MDAETSFLLTDPAREIVELCQSLSGGAANKPGDQYLAEHFGVAPYSTDFYRILVAISDRADQLEKLIQNLEFDADFRGEMVNHLSQIRLAFSNYGLQNQWKVGASTKLVAENLQPLKALSPLIRQVVSYRRLTDDDVLQIHAEASELLSWLEDANLMERDFVRAMLMDGLGEFLFRLDHIRWVGIGYTLESLRPVIRAYLALERGEINASDDPVALATLQRFRSFLAEVWQKTQTVREASETADWALRMYGAYEAVSKGAPVIAALLSGN